MMFPICSRWSAEKPCARAGVIAGKARTIAVTARTAARELKFIAMVLFHLLSDPKGTLLAFVKRNDVIGPHPAGRSDRESHLGACRQFTRGLFVATCKGGLSRRQIGVGKVTDVPVRHPQLL